MRKMLYDSSPVIEEIVSRFRDMSREHPGEIELELRLGGFSKSTFFPGVPPGVFQQLEEDMCEDCRLVTPETWSEIVDYHYMGLNGHPIRTRVVADSEKMIVDKKHTRKVVIQKVLVKRDDGSDDVARLTLSHEIPVLNPPASCVPTHVRIKQRRTFKDVREGATVWAYELSRTWSANSRSAVEHKQHMNEPIYEVECELVDEDGKYLMQRTDEEVSQSLIIKLKSLFGKDTVTKLKVERDGVPRESAQAKSKRSKRKE